MAQESDRSAGSAPTPGSRAQSGELPLPDLSAFFDSSLRLALALIKASDWGLLASRTGIQCPSEEAQFLYLFVEIDRDAILKQEKNFDEGLLLKFDLFAPSFYIEEFKINPALRTIAARIELTAKDSLRTVSGKLLQEVLEEIGRSGIFRRVRIAV